MTPATDPDTTADRATSDDTGPREVVVSGGSLDGLFTALALHERGADVTVYERAANDLADRGAGLVAQPFVLDTLAQHGVPDPESLTTTSHRRRYLDADGHVATAFDEEMRFTARDAISRALRDALPDDRYRDGREVVADTQRADGVTVELADGTTHDADLLVAAEGWLSDTRQRHLPDVSPEYAGYVAWRGVVPEPSLPDDLVATLDGAFTFHRGDDQLLLASLIPGPHGSTAPGDRRANWTWYDPVPPKRIGNVLTDAAGTHHDDTVPPGLLRDDLTDQLHARATHHAPVFTRLVRATPDPFVHPIADLAVPDAVHDRTILLGDAAYLARPHTAASTAKAARDAHELANSLARNSDTDTALADWASTRETAGRQHVERGRQTSLDRLTGHP